LLEACQIHRFADGLGQILAVADLPTQPIRVNLSYKPRITKYLLSFVFY
jgi:hypothetical protein